MFVQHTQGTSIDLSIETSEKCAIGSEKKTEILTAENCFRKIMDNKKGNDRQGSLTNTDCQWIVVMKNRRVPVVISNY
jgi:hypothetical protein